MSLRVLKHTRDPLETLERMLNKTTLVTQRVAHQHIMELGEKILNTTRGDDHEDKEKSIEEAVDASETRATRELRAALKRLRQEKDEERQRGLEKQKWYFERLAARVSQQRDRAEAERMRELHKKLEEEKNESLRQQWQECEILKTIAIEEACTALRKQLRREFAIEKEKAIAESLKKARETFKKHKDEVIGRTRRECQEEAWKEAERVSAIHNADLERLNLRYNILDQKYQKELAHRERVESDFRALQDDYKKFMDHTDGLFHSDYLMHLRYLGLQQVEKQISTVSYEDIEPLNLQT